MKLIERDRCAVTTISDLEHLFTIRKFPVFMGCVNQSQNLDLREDMSWWISRSSGLIQLRTLLPPEILYSGSHGAGTVGSVWRDHHRNFASFLHRTAPNAVLEIGGGHGILSFDYQNLREIPWTIVEPYPTLATHYNVRIIKDYFDENFNRAVVFDTLVHSHVFEHIYDSDRFMRQLARIMAPGKNLVFSVPNMEVMLNRKYANCLNFEHSLLLTEPYIDYLLGKYGFNLLHKQYFLEDHSIFYAAIRDDKAADAVLPSGLYEHNVKLFFEFIDYLRAVISDINEMINDVSSPVFLFGAHVFSQLLIELGLRIDKISYVLDNDDKKQGMRLYGTKLTVKSPMFLAEMEAPVVILKAGAYSREIRDQILMRINPNTRFIE